MSRTDGILRLCRCISRCRPSIVICLLFFSLRQPFYIESSPRRLPTSPSFGVVRISFAGPAHLRCFSVYTVSDASLTYLVYPPPSSPPYIRFPRPPYE